MLIYTDDQRYDCLGVVQEEQGEKARFPWLKTPNLDKLAREGIRFKNAFVVQSLCTPSRASFLTGQYTHTHNIFTNFTNFPPTMEHWGAELTAVGYQTAYIGKWHMGEQSGQRPGFSYSASYLGQGVFFDGFFEINGQTTPTEGWVDDVSTQYALDFIKENKDKNYVWAQKHFKYEMHDNRFFPNFLSSGREQIISNNHHILFFFPCVFADILHNTV